MYKVYLVYAATVNWLTEGNPGSQGEGTVYHVKQSVVA